MKTVRFGIIGAGLMGREFASAAARWCHLKDMDVRPELVSLCDTDPQLFDWYKANFPTITQTTGDYHQVLANKDVDAVYCAVPHHLHQQFYGDIISAGKHLLGEKPFGIDKPANTAILAHLAKHPGVFARCGSQFPFFPPVQRICGMIESGAFGRVLELNTGFLHSSDLNAEKPINWKRMVRFNGEYGVMGDLGMHACHVAFRAGWRPRNVRAVLSNVVPQRPDGKGGMAACDTWDNATLLCELAEPAGGYLFPWTLRTQRISPGQTNTWYIEVLGTKASARFTTQNPRRLELLEYDGGEQVWGAIDMGYETAFPAITGGIFEFGFTDAILQMWAGFLWELHHGKPIKKFAGCVTPAEAALSHKLFTAALESQKNASTVAVDM